jgi:hypothetical protein
MGRHPVDGVLVCADTLWPNLKRSKFLSAQISESQWSVSMHVTDLSSNSNPELDISSNQSSVRYSQSLLCIVPNIDKECLGMSITMNTLSTFVFYWDEQDSLKHPSLLQFTHTHTTRRVISGCYKSVL